MAVRRVEAHQSTREALARILARGYMRLQATKAAQSHAQAAAPHLEAKAAPAELPDRENGTRSTPHYGGSANPSQNGSRNPSPKGSGNPFPKGTGKGSGKGSVNGLGPPPTGPHQAPCEAPPGGPREAHTEAPHRSDQTCYRAPAK